MESNPAALNVSGCGGEKHDQTLRLSASGAEGSRDPRRGSAQPLLSPCPPCCHADPCQAPSPRRRWHDRPPVPVVSGTPSLPRAMPPPGPGGNALTLTRFAQRPRSRPHGSRATGLLGLSSSSPHLARALTGQVRPSARWQEPEIVQIRGGDLRIQNPPEVSRCWGIVMTLQITSFKSVDGVCGYSGLLPAVDIRRGSS
jgi:hypothetical protein